MRIYISRWTRLEKPVDPAPYIEYPTTRGESAERCLESWMPTENLGRTRSINLLCSTTSQLGRTATCNGMSLGRRSKSHAALVGLACQFIGPLVLRQRGSKPRCFIIAIAGGDVMKAINAFPVSGCLLTVRRPAAYLV